MQNVISELEIGREVTQTGSLALLGTLMDSAGPRLLSFVPTCPDDFRWLAMMSVLAPYFSGGALVHDVQLCAENAEGMAETPRDRMYTAVAKGIPSGKDIEESLSLPSPYNWFAATQWLRHCHRKRALQLFEIAMPVVMAGPASYMDADVEYERRLTECLWEDLMMRKKKTEVRINLSDLLITFPDKDVAPQLRYFRRLETGRLLGLENWERRRHRVK